MVNYFFNHPYKIEPRFRTLRKEFSLGNGRIDIIGRDKDAVVSLIEIKTRDSEICSGKRQVKNYQSMLIDFLGLIGVEQKIRGIVITPTRVEDVGIKKSKIIQPRFRLPLDIPTTREIFGLKDSFWEKSLHLLNKKRWKLG
jgi:hypothetical protein